MPTTSHLLGKNDEKGGQERERENKRKRDSDCREEPELDKRVDATTREGDEGPGSSSCRDEARRKNGSSRRFQGSCGIRGWRVRLEVVRCEVDAVRTADDQNESCGTRREHTLLPAKEWQHTHRPNRRDSNRCERC